MGTRVNSDGSMTIGCIEDVLIPADAVVKEEPKTAASPDAKPKPKTTRKTVKK